MNRDVREDPEVVEGLHQRLLAELQVRGAPQVLIDWFATGQKGPAPVDYRPRDPYLDAYRVYWARILPEERNV